MAGTGASGAGKWRQLYEKEDAKDTSIKTIPSPYLPPLQSKLV